MDSERTLQELFAGESIFDVSRIFISLISGFSSSFAARLTQIEQCIAAEAEDAVRERDTGPCLLRACLVSGLLLSIFDTH